MISIANNIIRNAELSDDEVLAYTFIKIHTYSTNYESCLFTAPQIVDQIQGYTNTHSAYNRTSCAIRGLAEKGVLKLTKEDATNWRVFMQSYSGETGRYVLVDANALRSIMDCKARGKATLLRYYLLLLSYMLPTCTREERWFGEQLGVSAKSIATYNKYLEELKLIYVYRPSGLYQSNIYVRYEDKDKVTSSCAKQRQGNDNRRYVAMYQNAIKGHPYSKAQLEDIRDHMIRRELERGYDERYDLGALIAKIKDYDEKEM